MNIRRIKSARVLSSNNSNNEKKTHNAKVATLPFYSSSIGISNSNNYSSDSNSSTLAKGMIIALEICHFEREHVKKIKFKKFIICNEMCRMMEPNSIDKLSAQSNAKVNRK